jgi:hypothetical protein
VRRTHLENRADIEIRRAVAGRYLMIAMPILPGPQAVALFSRHDG